jgi:hypothetical protein
MGINSHPEGGIYEASFGYYSDLYRYATLMSDMVKLSDYVWQKEFLNSI